MCQLDAKALYDRVQKENINYLKWPKWLYEKLNRQYLFELDSLIRKKKQLKVITEKPHARKEALIAHFFSEYVIHQNYFYSK